MGALNQLTRFSTHVETIKYEPVSGLLAFTATANRDGSMKNLTKTSKSSGIVYSGNCHSKTRQAVCSSLGSIS